MLQMLEYDAENFYLVGHIFTDDYRSSSLFKVTATRRIYALCQRIYASLEHQLIGFYEHCIHA